MIHSLLNFKIEVAVIARTEDNPEVNFYPFSQEEMSAMLALANRGISELIDAQRSALEAP